MKTFFSIIIIIILLILLSIIYNMFISKWTFVNNWWKFLEISTTKNILYINWYIWDSSIWVSDIEYSIEDEKIYISFYTKFFKFLLNPKNEISIDLDKKWIYKIYYKNSDWSINFIKEIEYK